MPDYRETVEKLRAAMEDRYAGRQPQHSWPDLVNDAIAALTIQADELATLRAENARLTGLVSHLITQETP